MQGDELAQASDLLAWDKRLLASIGIWPKDDNNLRFGLCFVYIFIHVGMEYGDFVQYIGNFQEILANISETATYTMLLVKLVVFRKNRILSQMIDAMNEDCANDKYKSLREQKIYGHYNWIAKTYHKAILSLVCSTAFLYYLKPLSGYLFRTSSNSTTPFILPYRTRVFYEITEVHTYALTYAYQAFTLHIASFGVVGTDGLLVSLTLHVCGELAVLADRITSLKKKIRNAHYLEIRSIVKRHLGLTRMAMKIDKVFSTIFLGQLSGCAAIICLNGFNVIRNSEGTQKANLITFLFYEATILTLLYSYCFIGECLIKESQRVHDAFFQCAWYEMPTSQSKDFIICMITSQKPLHLTAGKLYIFSFEIFAQSHLLSAAEVVNWNRRILSLLGIWPEDPRNYRFSLFLGYLIIHVTLEYAYLYKNIKQLENVVTSMTENIPFTVILLKTVLFRKNKNLLCKIIRKVGKSLAAGDYGSDREVKIFLRYNTIAKNYVRVVVPLILSSSIVYFAKPLFTQFVSIQGNHTLTYDLPYRVRLFYDVADTRVYVLTYVLQTPLVLIATFGYTGTDCLMVTLTLHVCGELSILAMRIKNLTCNARGSHKAIRTLINRHVQLIRMARIIEDVFNVLLLGQLFGGTFLICFLGYNVLANTTGGRETDLLNFSLYGFSVVVLLYVYCYVGDCLTQESVKVRDAFFHCTWYDLPAKNSKSFVTCIIQSQKPLHLTAGKFYVFSLERFADVIKTSTAYLSVLRSFV